MAEHHCPSPSGIGERTGKKKQPKVELVGQDKNYCVTNTVTEPHFVPPEEKKKACFFTFGKATEFVKERKHNFKHREFPSLLKTAEATTLAGCYSLFLDVSSPCTV